MSYDIRSPGPQTSKQPSEPYIEFLGYEGNDNPSDVPGFDVYQKFAAIATGGNVVKMYNTSTGEEVRMGERDAGFEDLGHHVQALKFAPDLWDKYNPLHPFALFFALHMSSNVGLINGVLVF